MNIAGTEYNINHKALEIYISGCDGACEGCHNPGLWDFDVGKEWSLWGKSLRQKLSTDMVENIWIMGGEPLLQNTYSLFWMLHWLKQFKKPIMLWTRFEERYISLIIKNKISYAKIGGYQEDSESYIEPLFGIGLASKNQEIVKI